MLAINTTELFSEIESLPLDLKTKLIEKLLSSINPIEKNIDMLWKNEINLRVESIESGTAELVDGENVFQKIKAKLLEEQKRNLGVSNSNSTLYLFRKDTVIDDCDIKSSPLSSRKLNILYLKSAKE